VMLHRLGWTVYTIEDTVDAVNRSVSNYFNLNALSVDTFFYFNSTIDGVNQVKCACMIRSVGLLQFELFRVSADLTTHPYRAKLRCTQHNLRSRCVV
jgi:hypothetical protein